MRWRRPAYALILTATVAGGCGGPSNKPKLASASLTAADAKRVVTSYVDVNNNCHLMTDRFIVKAWGESTPTKARAACAKDTDEGLRSGEYAVLSARAVGARAIVQLQLDAGGQWFYTLVPQDGHWRIDGFRETKRARLGRALLFEDAYEQNGQPTNVAVQMRLLSFDSHPIAPPYTEPESGKRFIRFRLRLINKGDATLLSVEDFSGVDAAGQRFRGNGTPFEPSLGNNVVDVQPGETVTGYVSMQVPKGARLRELRAAPVGAGDAVPLVWRLP